MHHLIYMFTFVIIGSIMQKGLGITEPVVYMVIYGIMGTYYGMFNERSRIK